MRGVLGSDVVKSFTALPERATRVRSRRPFRADRLDYLQSSGVRPMATSCRAFSSEQQHNFKTLQRRTHAGNRFTDASGFNSWYSIPSCLPKKNRGKDFKPPRVGFAARIPSRLDPSPTLQGSLAPCQPAIRWQHRLHHLPSSGRSDLLAESDRWPTPLNSHHNRKGSH